MHKPLVAATPEELAAALGLSKTEAKQWQVQHALLKRPKKIVRKDNPCLKVSAQSPSEFRRPR